MLDRKDVVNFCPISDPVVKAVRSMYVLGIVH